MADLKNFQSKYKTKELYNKWKKTDSAIAKKAKTEGRVYETAIDFTSEEKQRLEKARNKYLEAEKKASEEYNKAETKEMERFFKENSPRITPKTPKLR